MTLEMVDLSDPWKIGYQVESPGPHLLAPHLTGWWFFPGRAGGSRILGMIFLPKVHPSKKKHTSRIHPRKWTAGMHPKTWRWMVQISSNDFTKFNEGLFLSWTPAVHFSVFFLWRTFWRTSCDLHPRNPWIERGESTPTHSAVRNRPWKMKKVWTAYFPYV